MNDKLEGILKEAILVCFKILFQHFTRWAEESHSPGRESKHGPSADEGVSTLHSILTL